mmetsp:Transcript_5182/g.8002  ORF Transcript_5182/g.8002 Transcript_5182/m.8002 type:complete len:103 (+) Transcript_5182:108-416(+)
MIEMIAIPGAVVLGFLLVTMVLLLILNRDKVDKNSKYREYLLKKQRAGKTQVNKQLDISISVSSQESDNGKQSCCSKFLGLVLFVLYMGCGVGAGLGSYYLY